MDNPVTRLTRYIAIAACVLIAGMLISFGRHATWWLLALSALAWVQGRNLRREISTSGAPLRIFHIVAWALLGLAVVSLLPMPARMIGDVAVVLVALALSIGQLTRRTRN